MGSDLMNRINGIGPRNPYCDMARERAGGRPRLPAQRLRLGGDAAGAALARGQAGLLRGLSTDPEAGALALSYRGRGASSRAAELASLLNALVASGEEVLALVRSGKVDWDG